MDVLSASLENWEEKFAQQLRNVGSAKLSQPGGLLPLIPDHPTWDLFVEAVCRTWSTWRLDLTKYPSCLVFLYAGIAFYEYDDNTFWPQFSRCVGSTPLSTNQQTETNSRFAEASVGCGLMLRHHEHGTDYVGSAVNYVGIPLLLWEDFIDLCEWALRRSDWASMSDIEWQECMQRRYGGRVRLRRFLTENRDIARVFVKDMLEVREILTEDAASQIADIAQASILRIEYFDEVPETAQFLRPDNPESLFQNRARLVWNDRTQHLLLQLPATDASSLPAAWHVDGLVESAATTPTQVVFDSKAFGGPIKLRLESADGAIETQRIRGIGEWALFDMDKDGRIVNLQREQYPLRSYLLLSQTPLNIISREGFEEEDSPINECIELRDGINCYATRLWPFKSRAELQIQLAPDDIKVLTFRAQARIETRVYLGKSYKAAYFQRVVENHVKMDHLPILCVSIPDGYFNDNDAEVKSHFRVLVDDRPASGEWDVIHPMGPQAMTYYSWNWSYKPIIERRPGIEKLTSLRELGTAYKASDLSGMHVFTIDGSPHYRASVRVEILHRVRHEIDQCWRDLPGAVLPLFLVCQSFDGMKWDELLVAKNVVAPDLALSPHLLRRYEKDGILIQRGNKWQFYKSRAMIDAVGGDQYRLRYCGDPSTLWGLYRWHQREQGGDLAIVAVVNERGTVPHMEMIWPDKYRHLHQGFLQKQQVVLNGGPWTH